MIRAHHLSCALPFCYYVIDSTSDHQALALGGWGPLLPSTRAFESLDETVLLPEILSSSIFHTDAPGELFTVPLMLGLNPSMPPCHTQEKVQALENGAKAESWPGTFTPTCLPTCAQPQITPNTHTHIPHTHTPLLHTHTHTPHCYTHAHTHTPYFYTHTHHCYTHMPHCYFCCCLFCLFCLEQFFKSQVMTCLCFFNWGIVGLHCCVHFRCPASESVIHTHISTLP